MSTAPPPEPRRVAIVFHRSDVVGGASRYALALGRALRDRGHDVRFFVPGAGHYTELLDREGLSWRSVPGMGRTLHPRRNAEALRSLGSAVAAFDPDLVSAQASTAGALCRLLRNRWGVPVIYTPHSWSFAPGTPTREAVSGWLVEAALRRRADATIAVSRFERDLGLARHVVVAERTHVIHNGVADPFAGGPAVGRDRAPGADRTRIVCVARFEPQKDHATLLDAFALLDDRTAELLLVGDGPLLDDRRRQARELGIDDRIIWAGAVDDVNAQLAGSDLFVLASLWESLPLSIIEAMAAGLPVVATEVGGVGELIEDGQTGSLVEPGDAAALASSLRRFVADADLRATSGRAGRLRYEARFTEDRMLEPTIALYEEVSSSRVRP